MSASEANGNAGGRDSSPDFAALKAKNTKRNLSIVLALVLALGGSAAYLVVTNQHEADQKALATASALRGCLLGGALGQGETPALRFRRLQLPVMTRSDSDAVTKADALWPTSCRKPAQALKELLKLTVAPEDWAKLDKLTKFLGDPASSSKDASAVLEPALAMLDAAIPGPVPSDKPIADAVLNVDTLARVPPVSKRGTALSQSYTEDNPGLALPILITEESLQAPLLCSFSSGNTASCDSLESLASVKGHGLRMLGTSDASSQSLIFAGRRGSEGVFVAGDSEPVAKLYSYGGYTSADGTISVLGWDIDNRNIVLVRKPPGKAPEHTTLKPNFRVGNYFYSSQLLWDQVLVRGITPDNERRLFTLPLNSQGTNSFEMVDIGELTEPGVIRRGEEEAPHITGCRTKTATIVRVRGNSDDFITFEVNGKFSMPVFAPTSGVLGCHGTTATLVTTGYAKSGTRLYHTACTSAGCNNRTLKAAALDRGLIEMRPESVEDVQAVDLAGKLLTVWRAGSRGGLRMRIAKPELFEKSPDTVLFDDLIDKHKLTDISTLLGFRLYSREDFAVLLLSSMAGLHAYRISPDGSVKPFTVKGGG